MSVLSCDDVRERAGAWIDGEVAPGVAAAIAAHAATCRACAADIDAQEATRTLVVQHAATLRGTAPAELRAAVAREVRGASPAVVVPFPVATAAASAGGEGAPVSRRRWSTTVARWSVAAALVLAVGGVFVVGTFGGDRLFAAQLALDHYKCLLIDGGHAGVSHEALEASWRADRGWNVSVPPSDATAGVTLIGLRRCIAGEGQMAHVLYEVGGHRLSLFIVPSAVDALAANLPIMGVDTKSWTHGGRTYALVGVTSAVPDRVVEFMRAHAR